MSVNNGLYNSLFGVNEEYKILLGMLSLAEGNFGRFRDIYLNEDGTKIIVVTRCGGGNREDYADVFKELSNHENYITDYDDDFDSTYCYFEFGVPDIYKQTCKIMSTGNKPKTVSEKFDEHIKEMENMSKEQIQQELINILGSDALTIFGLNNKE